MLQEVVHKLLTTDVVSFNAGISACEKGKQCKEALGLLQEMVHQLLMLDVVSSCASISGCEKAKQ